MFTGIVQTQGSIVSLTATPAGKRLTAEAPNWPDPRPTIALGDSICVSGVCLTVAQMTGSSLSFDVINETLTKSKLGSLNTGDAVNLESSLTPTTPMGGHFVQGHVDGLGVITHIHTSQGERRLTIEPPAELMAYIIPKGSITLDGVSLTIASTAAKSFDVAIIPTTLQITTLATVKQGDRLNIETDILSRTIVHHLRAIMGSDGKLPAVMSLSMDKLRNAGF